MSNNVFPENISVNLQKTAFGELATAQLTPRAQITAQYGVTSNVFSVSIGGTITNNNSLFQVNSGTGANNVTAVLTDQQVQVKAGQGLTCELSAIFDTGAADNTQIAGLITSDSLIGFGYKGADFGIIFATGGVLEIQELTITTGATGSESATITIDSTVYNVPITNAGINGNAYEIATYLDDNVPGFSFTSNEDVVTCMALLPELGTGTFSFSSSTAVGSFVQIADSNVPTEALILKEDWNVNPDIDIDPSLGNVYKVQFQNLGFGNTFFYVEDPETGRYELVHIHKYANTTTIPDVANPTFRGGWATRNYGNTTDITVQGSGVGVFIEGNRVTHGESDGECAITSMSTGLAPQNVLSLRNRMVLNGQSNRAGLLLRALSLSTESTKLTTFYIYKNPVFTTPVTWEYIDVTGKIAETSSTLSFITSGDIIACYQTRGDLLIDINEVIKELRPIDSICIAAQITSGTASDVAASISFIGDL